MEFANLSSGCSGKFRNQHTGLLSGGLKCRAGQTMHCLTGPQLQEILGLSQLVKAIRAASIVHRHHTPGMQGVTHRLGTDSIHCVGTAHRHQRQIHRANGGQLLRCQLVAQIPQMSNRHPAGSEHPNGVGAPEGTPPDRRDRSGSPAQ